MLCCWVDRSQPAQAAAPNLSLLPAPFSPAPWGHQLPSPVALAVQCAGSRYPCSCWLHLRTAPMGTCCLPVCSPQFGCPGWGLAGFSSASCLTSSQSCWSRLLVRMTMTGSSGCSNLNACRWRVCMACCCALQVPGCSQLGLLGLLLMTGCKPLSTFLSNKAGCVEAVFLQGWEGGGLSGGNKSQHARLAAATPRPGCRTHPAQWGS